MNERIELSSIQATAYWWINIIRHKVREIVLKPSTNKKEIAFAKIFYYYTETEWRILYLGLIGCIADDVNNYVLQGNDIDAFHQDTNVGGHDKINSELSKLVNKEVPDIRLADYSSKDYVIYTFKTGALLWYKSAGVYELAYDYEPSYILTGDEDELEFYNLFISIVLALHHANPDFRSVSKLREKFCTEYKKLNNLEEPLEELYIRFNKAFAKACDREIIMGRPYIENYFCSFKDIDYIGLEKYSDIAKHYATIILKEKEANGGSISNNVLQYRM